MPRLRRTPSRMIRWGLIGCGDVAEQKSGPGFQQAADSALVAVMRRDAGRAKDFAARHWVPRWYSDARELVEDPEVDAISIATPPSSHRELALLACAAGKPALVEKPMALNHTECVRMVEAFRAAGVPLFVAYYRRVQPRFIQMKQLVESGAIGVPRVALVQLTAPPPRIDSDPLPWRLQPEISGGGLFADLGCHTLDLLDFILGPIAEVSGFASNQGRLYGAEDAVAMSFRFQNGAHGQGAWQFNTAERRDRLEILGSEGSVSVSTFGADPLILREASGKETRFDLPMSTPVQQPLIQSVVDELLGRGQCPSTGESGARTAWVMDQVLKDSSP
jgi:1,5-anhydro-D-fructose reductase (1,5-anhydro-D-mannitol-forming)